MAVYVNAQRPEVLSGWDKELEALSQEKQAEWLGSLHHIKGDVFRVRRNQSIKIYEIEVTASLKKHYPHALFPSGSWAPIQNVCLPPNCEIMKNYYAIKSTDKTLTVVTSNGADLVQAYNEGNFEKEFAKKAGSSSAELVFDEPVVEKAAFNPEKLGSQQ
jgi:hypothetical protein